MVVAIVHLQTGPVTEMALDYLRNLPVMNRQWSDDRRLFLWEALCSRALAGELEFRGVPANSNSAAAIDPMSLRGSKPDFQADTLDAAGILYHGVGVFSAVRPLPKTAPVKAGPTGGAPEQYDWPAFTRELINAIWEGGLPDRRAFRKHMNKWCAATWEKAPDESTVRARLGALLPTTMPEIREK